MQVGSPLGFFFFFWLVTCSSLGSPERIKTFFFLGGSLGTGYEFPKRAGILP